MNILLINSPGKISFISPPLGLLYIAANLRKDGHEVYITDYNLEKLDYQKIIKFIREKNIKIAGISIVTPKVYNAMELANAIKAGLPKISIIAGGPHPTLMPEQLLKDCNGFDYVIQREGELRFRELVNRLERNISIEDMDGLAFRKNDQIINHPAQTFIQDLDSLPMPARDLIDVIKYSNYMKTGVYPVTTMMTSRGCPFQCIYCSKPVTGFGFRALKPENVIKEIDFLINNYGIKEIIFYDDSFTIHRPRVMELCDLMIKEGINAKIRWQCETRVNIVDEELLKKMKMAGCYLIAYGIESGSDRVLGILRKGTTTNQIIKAVELTKKASIQVLGYFMLGIPGENEQEIKKTIQFSKDLNVDFAQFSIATAYPGTMLYQMAKEQNKITDDWSKSMYALGGKPTISLSDVPIDKLYYYTKKAYRSFYFRPSYLWERMLQIKSVNDLIYNLKGLKTLLKV